MISVGFFRTLLAYLVVALLALLPRSALAQGPAVRCTGGRVSSPRTAGRCCWPGQSWARREARCSGAPRCPEGLTAEGDACVPAPPYLRDAPVPASAAPALPSPAMSGATAAPALAFADPRPTREEYQRARDSVLPASSAGRVLLGMLLGYTFSTLYTVAGVLPFAFACDPRSSACLVGGTLTGYSLGVLFGMSTGVTLAGAAVSGVGHFGWALLGSLVGMVAFVPLGLLVASPSSGGSAVALNVLFATLPLTGSIVAYETASANNARRIRTAAGERAAARPVVFPLSFDRGAGAGVGFAF